MGKNLMMTMDIGRLTDVELRNKQSSGTNNPMMTMDIGRLTDVGFVDGPELTSKNQAVEAVSGRLVPGFHYSYFTPWHNTSNLQLYQGYIANSPFGFQPAQTVNLVNKDASSVSQPRQLDSGASMGRPYWLKNDNKVANPFNAYCTISPVTAPINNIYEGSSSLGYGFHNAKNNFMATSPGNSNPMSIGYNSVKVADYVLSSINPSRKDECSLTLGEPYVNAASDIMPILSANSKGNRDSVVTGMSDSNANNNFLTLGCPQSKENPTFRLFGSVINTPPGGSSHSSEFATINQASVIAAIPEKDDLVYSDVNAAPKNPKELDSKAGSIPNTRKRTNKKDSPHGFPVNVKSLLLSGILDGANVKYVSWSREKTVRAVINQTGYLCCCVNCKSSKILNAHELEAHASCKTKHPNSNIYFENGKSIYQVVLNLRKTPRDKLIDAIPNMLGSAVNEKNFGVWKETFLKANCELQRINDKDDV